MFTKLENCSPEFFSEWHEDVLSIQMSPHDLLNSVKVNLDANTEKKVVMCAGVKDIETLKRDFPDKFSKENIQEFVGAEVFGRKRNMQGQRLKNYIKSVQLGKEFNEHVKLEVFENWTEMNIVKLTSFDVLILNLIKSNMKFVQYWIDSLSQECRVKDYFSIFLMLESQDDLQIILKHLDFWKDKPDFIIKQVLFRKENTQMGEDRFDENLSFCVLFGKVNIFGGKISAMNDVVGKDLIKVVKCVMPPSGKVGYMSKGDGKVVKIHSNKDADYQVVYFVTSNEHPKVQERFLLNAPASDTSGKQVQVEKKVSQVGRK